MGIGMDQPQGNVYSADEYNSVPIFPNYMESAHQDWLGFVPPGKIKHPFPYLKLINGDVYPVVNGEYELKAYSDASYSCEINIAEAMQKFPYVIRPHGFTASGLTGGRVGLKVLWIDPCVDQLAIDVIVKPRKDTPEYYEIGRSVTSTVNEAIDTLLYQVDTLQVVKESFRLLTDIRELNLR
jgi:hypothetical protein